MADTVTGPTILQQNDKRVVIKIVINQTEPVQLQFLVTYPQWMQELMEQQWLT